MLLKLLHHNFFGGNVEVKRQLRMKGNIISNYLKSLNFLRACLLLTLEFYAFISEVVQCPQLCFHHQLVHQKRVRGLCQLLNFFSNSLNFQITKFFITSLGGSRNSSSATPISYIFVCMTWSHFIEIPRKCGEFSLEISYIRHSKLSGSRRKFARLRKLSLKSLKNGKSEFVKG